MYPFTVHVCSTGAACLGQLFQLHDSSMVDLTPTIVIIEVPHDEVIPDPRPRSRSPSPHSRPPAGDLEIHTPEEDVYGLMLLQRLISEAHLRSLSKLIVPITIIRYPSPDNTVTNDGTSEMTAKAAIPTGSLGIDRRLLKRCLDLGAADVISSPLQAKCITSLEIQAYRAHKEAAKDQQLMMEVRRGRKRSWVGVNEEKPFAYLREAMVSGLMKGICLPGYEVEDKITNVKVSVSTARQAAIGLAVGRWHFSAHDLSDDELLVAAMLMFRHALTMPELDRWRISTGKHTSILASQNPPPPFVLIRILRRSPQN
jgi:hypothetical protein